MKKIISVLLAVIILAMPFTLTASAEGIDDPLTPVHYVQLPEKTEQFEVVPLDGYSQYVVHGEEFVFRVIPAPGYSVQMLQVSYYDTEHGKHTSVSIEPMKAPDTFTIETVTTNITVSCNLVMENSRASLFRALVEFIRQILELFSRIFGGTGT
jgi:hypothetical protein